MFAFSLLTRVQDLFARCRAQNFTLVTAESCTGGLLSACLTEISGASHVFERGFVTYSNEAKMELLGVEKKLLDRFGAVSAEVAHAMACGALAQTKANLAISITGIAGPDGGSKEKPVGLVYMCCATRARHLARRFQFSGNRRQIRHEAVERAVEMLLENVGK